MEGVIHLLTEEAGTGRRSEIGTHLVVRDIERMRMVLQRKMGIQTIGKLSNLFHISRVCNMLCLVRWVSKIFYRTGRHA